MAYIRGKYTPVRIRFSYLENAILGLLRAEIVRNICFQIVYSINDLLAMAHQLQSR